MIKMLLLWFLSLRDVRIYCNNRGLMFVLKYKDGSDNCWICVMFILG